MKSGNPWQVSGVRQRTREAAREAARRSGMSVGEWLETVVRESAQDDEPPRRMHADDNDEPQRRTVNDGERYSDFDDEAPPPPSRRRYSDYDERHRRVPDEALAEVNERLDTLGRWIEQQRQPRPADGEISAVNERLDTLSRQLDQLAHASAQIAQMSAKPPRDDETPRQIAKALSQLDRRLDQLITEGRSTASEIERRVNAVDRAVASLNQEPLRSAPAVPAAPATPLEQALAEIAERQRALDGEAAPRLDLPRAPTQGLNELEKQLRSINARIETIKPCGIEGAVDTLRDDLAEIGLMIKDAMPRQAVQALEAEVRSLSERIDSKRHAGGADSPDIAGVERGLAEVRDALRGLTPAENLVGIDEAVRKISQKIDSIAVTNQDPAAIEQLENAIASLRNVVSHVASNDALAALSEEVRHLSSKFEHVASPDILAALEQRIAIIADALQARHEGGGEDTRNLEAVVHGLTDKLERLQLTRNDHAAVGHLEDRIVKLVEKLDSSDARLSHLEAIERGLAELLIHIEHQRLPQLAQGEAAPPHEVDWLKRDVQRTQDSIEAVHGTLGHVVDRLATIESGLRNAAVAMPKAANIEPVRPPARTPAKPPRPARTAKAFQPEPEPAPEELVPVAAAPQPVDPERTRTTLPSAPVPLDVPTPAPVPVPATALGNPAVATERRPIDPTLPPDHPIEPGSDVARKRNGTSPADRIAASEAALGPAKPPVIPDPGGKSNFINAARRAAKTAVADTVTPAKADAGRSKRTDSQPASPLSSRVRSFLVAASVVAIVLGAFQLLTSMFSDSDATSETPQVEQTGSISRADEAAAAPVASPPIPASEPPSRAPAPPSAPPAVGRQVLLPGNVPFLSSSAGIVLPRETSQPIASAPVKSADTAAPADRLPTGSVRAPSLASVPAETAVVPPPPTARPTGADKLPASIGSGGLRAAAVKGDPTAEFEIAVRFADGRGVPQDLTAAAEWFERAAKHGLAPAQFRLGGLYEKGMGVKKDLDGARRLYLAAAQAGNAKAMHNLAVLFSEGIDGKPDYQTAASWFRKAADHGVADSQYNLGILYARGIGVESNLAEAYKWFSLAAREGDKEAGKKRDDVGGRLNQQTLMSARAATQVWTAQPQPEAASQVKTPAGGWDSVAAPSTAKRRIDTKSQSKASAD